MRIDGIARTRKASLALQCGFVWLMLMLFSQIFVLEVAAAEGEKATQRSHPYPSPRGIRGIRVNVKDLLKPDPHKLDLLKRDNPYLDSSSSGNSYRGMVTPFNDDIIGNVWAQFLQLIGKWLNETFGAQIAFAVVYSVPISFSLYLAETLIRSPRVTTIVRPLSIGG